MLNAIKLILSWILAVMAVGAVIGGIAFFAAVGVGIAGFLALVTVIGFIAYVIYEWISSWYNRLKRRRQSSNLHR